MITTRIYRLVTVCLMLGLATVAQGQQTNYENEEVGVRLALGEEWQVFTSREGAPEMVKAAFPPNKGKNESPLFFAVHNDQQLFARLLVEPAVEKDLTRYSRLLGIQMNSQNIEITAARYASDPDAVELEYVQPQTGLVFRERIAIANGQYLVRLGFWTYTAAYDRYFEQINRLFDGVQLLTDGQEWDTRWASLQDKLPLEHIEGVELTIQEVASTELECKDSSSSLLWEVKGNNSTVYLFGSLHLGDASFYPMPEKIETTFRNADHVVFEVDPRSISNPQVAAQIQQQGMLAPDEQLSDLVSEPVVNKLTSTLNDMGLPAANFMRFRPWFLTLMLTNLQITSMGYVPDYGVEQYILREIPPDAKVLELETINDQLAYLQHLDGEAFLAYTLFGFEAGKQKVKIMMDAWRCADKPRLAAMFDDEFNMTGAMAQDMDLDTLKEKLLIQRNVTMADGIGDYLQNGEGSYFVVVGTAHYLGEGSVIELLRERDYQVTPVSL